MATLLMRLVGPMQSWDKTSRFDARGTGREPTKSGVLGILAAALGIDRSDWTNLEPLAHLALAVRNDRPGTPVKDHQTAGRANTDTLVRADGSQARAGSGVAMRHYLADAAFLVGMEGPDDGLLKRIHDSLQNPASPLALGLQAYIPAQPLWLPDHLHPVQEGPLYHVLTHQPWIATRRDREPIPERLRLSWESTDGTGVRCMDQPLSSLAEPRLGARFVHIEWIPFPGEALVSG